ELQVGAFRWFDRYLGERDQPIEEAARAIFAHDELRVFDRAPPDAINRQIDRVFVPQAKPLASPENAAVWRNQCEVLLERLRQNSFRAWPSEQGTLEPATQTPPLEVKRCA